MKFFCIYFSILSAPGISLKSSPASQALESESAPPLNYNKPSEAVCSVQDLLANVSCAGNADVGDSADADDAIGVADDSEPLYRAEEKTGPSSLERSVTRELNLRLSSSDFRGSQMVEENSPICENSPSADTPRSTASHCSSQVPVSHGLSTHSSPNSLGIPPRANGFAHDSMRRDLSASILRTSVRKNRAAASASDIKVTSLPHLTTSSVDVTSRSHREAELDNAHSTDAVKPPNVELAVIDKMHIIEVESSGMSSENQSDYENIYESQKNTRRDLPPKPAHLLAQNLDETQTTQSSIPHDYENMCAVNINRAMWGVRHWKTYSDIEDRIHDNSTVKERLKNFDSTLSSSHYSDYSVLKCAQTRKSLSMAEDCDSVLSRSLPDLSSLRLETCYEEPAEEEEEKGRENVKDDIRLLSMLNQLRANRPLNKSNSVDNIPNYETIWVGDVEKPDNSGASSQMDSLTSKSSLVVTIGDVCTKESLCNLYYSTMSDLSFRYYSQRMRNNCSGRSGALRRSTQDAGQEMVRAISVPDNKTLLEVSKMIEKQTEKEQEEEKAALEPTGVPSQNPNGISSQISETPLGTAEASRPRRKFSMLREKFENPWTPKKSPMWQRQPTQRRNSFQERTAKALQAGMKVFRRQRVHVITPKKGEDKDTPRLKSPFRSKNTTPSTPAAKINGNPPLDSKIVGTEGVKLPLHVTPQRMGTISHRLTKGTPKTSTPDSSKQASAKTPVTALDTDKVKSLRQGPKTSTPEGNKQVQMSILSSVSSVVPSPPDGLQKMDTSEQRRLPLSENLPHEALSKPSVYGNVCQEPNSMGAVPRKPTYGALVPAKSAVNLRVSRVTTTGENVNSPSDVTSKSGIQASQSLMSLQALKSPQGQPMFTGFLGLPQVQCETKSTINIVESICSPTSHGNVTVSRSIILSSAQSPKFNMQKSTLSPNSKIFSRRI